MIVQTLTLGRAMYKQSASFMSGTDSGVGLCINRVQFDDGTDSGVGLCIKRVQFDDGTDSGGRAMYKQSPV